MLRPLKISYRFYYTSRFKGQGGYKNISQGSRKVGTALEINSKHSQLSVENIKIAMEESVDFIINSDAHTPEDVGNVKESLKRAKDAELSMDRIKNIVK